MEIQCLVWHKAHLVSNMGSMSTNSRIINQVPWRKGKGVCGSNNKL